MLTDDSGKELGCAICYIEDLEEKCADKLRSLINYYERKVTDN